MTSKYLKAGATVVSRDFARGLMILDTATGRYFQPDRAGADIWRRVAGGSDPAAVASYLAAELRRPLDDVREDVESFIETAKADGLLVETETIRPLSSEQPLTIGPSSLARAGDLSALHAHFEARHFVRLPRLLDAALLDLVVKQVEEGTFVDRAHHGIGTELCLVPGVATGVLQMLFNDPAMLDAVAAITGCEGRCFDGRVYRLSPTEGHYDSWHSDVGEDRLVALSLNLSREPYQGGDLEIRPAAAKEATETVANHDFGSAVMFRISPALRHRVNAVQGTAPRTVFAGWFRSTPDFQDLFFGSIPAATA